MASQFLKADETIGNTETKAMPQLSDIHTARESSSDETDANLAHLKWWTDAEESSVRRKLDWHILPML